MSTERLIGLVVAILVICFLLWFVVNLLGANNGR
jgi:hypothetical protein